MTSFRILDDICSLIVDCEHKTAPTQESGYPSIRTPNIGRGRFLLDGVNMVSEETYRAWSQRAVPQEDDLILAREAPIGNVAIITAGLKVCLGQRTVLIRPDKKKVNPHYLTYLLLGDEIQGRFHAYSGGATVAHLNMKDIRNLELPALPSLEIQRKIASILSAYDDLIENNTRRIAILEEMAQRIFEEWFVRYRFPGHKNLQPIESELGMIPDKWEVRPLCDILTIYRGKSYKGSELVSEGGLPFINLKCINRDGGFRKSGLKRFNGSYKATQTVKQGDIVVAVTDMTQERRLVARCGRVPRLGAEFGVISMDLVKIAAKNVPTDYLYGVLRWSGMPDEVKKHANGVNVLHLSPERIENYKIVFPGISIAEQYDRIVSPMLQLCDALEEKNNNLRATRDFLLPKLISGEIDVSKVSTVAEKAVAA